MNMRNLLVIFGVAASVSLVVACTNDMKSNKNASPISAKSLAENAEGGKNSECSPIGNTERPPAPGETPEDQKRRQAEADEKLYVDSVASLKTMAETEITEEQCSEDLLKQALSMEYKSELENVFNSEISLSQQQAASVAMGNEVDNIEKPQCTVRAIGDISKMALDKFSKPFEENGEYNDASQKADIRARLIAVNQSLRSIFDTRQSQIATLEKSNEDDEDTTDQSLVEQIESDMNRMLAIGDELKSAYIECKTVQSGAIDGAITTAPQPTMIQSCDENTNEAKALNQVIGDFVKSYGLFNGDEVSLKPPVNLNPSMKLRFHKELKSRSSAMLDQAEILKKKMVGE